MHRIVHLDLKGAPLKIPYLEKVLLTAQSWGATGFLFEWEDTFPYSGELADIGSQKDSGGDGMYSMEEVQHIFQFARDNGLVAIQLVQTIGHLEFVLKHPKYIPLREIPNSPAVLCPSREGSQDLVMKMVDQTLDAQPDAQFFHIGADEVWHKAVCSDCQNRASTRRYQGDALFLEYIQDLTLFIKRKRPNLTILMWDDMLRSINEDAFKAYSFLNVQPVYWNYNTIDNFRTDHVLWQKYTKLFPKIWAGSAFKGANGSCQALSPVCRYVSNHEAWLREFSIYKESINFVGIILTGWSRYDHYATLCELMPVMLPSLASCLKLLTKEDHLGIEHVIREYLPPQEWPGEELARCVHSFVILRERCTNLLHGEMVSTWLNPWQVERGYTVSIHVQSIAYSARILLEEAKNLSQSLSTHLHSVTGKRSKEEWLRSNVTPILTKMTELCEVAENAMKRDAGIRP
ncbi:unnamed protein product [Arctia plantaginis]|uniref:beta-N-acetylhexosaminidase n=1 Tax=Arctia plantaginis TaxID=874455 RepID=A0A8S1AYZ1_ARCPL|nr:unnamed protein product [Arctia plantaginis]CAB3253081.1 unnamed protein product [Arctia plantaginis]